MRFGLFWQTPGSEESSFARAGIGRRLKKLCSASNWGLRVRG